jgi:hypothetical protein
MKKLLLSLCFILQSCTICIGQSSFQEITPGTSTRDQVNRILGTPLNTDNTIIADHTPPAGLSKLEVVYSRDPNVVNQINIYFPKPISRQALIQKLKLPQQADFMKTGENGMLHEFFGGPAFLFLIYQSAETDSGVTLMVYNSKETFEGILKKFRGEVDVPLLNAQVQSLRFYHGPRGQIVPFGQRRYETRFPRSQTMCINWELVLNYPAPGRRITFTIEFVYSGARGVNQKYRTDTFIESDWKTSFHGDGAGWAEPGRWSIGIYRVELFIEGKQIAAGSFEVY